MNEKEVFNLSTKQFEAAPQEVEKDLGALSGEKGLGATSPIETLQSPEMVEAEQIAREKLEKLMSDDFKDFAVRFMNIEEYRRIIDRRSLPSAEVTVFGSGRWQPSFHEYIEHAQERQRGWADVAWDQTDWEFSTMDMNVYNYILERLRESHRTQESKEATLDKFRKTLADIINHMPAISIRVEDFEELQKQIILDFPHTNIEEIFKEEEGIDTDEGKEELFNRFFPNASSDLKEKLKDWQDKTKENGVKASKIIIIQKFLDDKDYLKNGKLNLRNVINAIAYLPKRFRDQERQYHIALILDLEGAAIGGGALRPSWGYIGTKQDIRGQSTYNKEKAILGAITTMPNKELWQEMSELSARAGAMAHPILDRNGVVRWPKVQKVEPENEVFDLDEKKFVPKN